MKDGWQHELPEDWLSGGNPWEFERPEVAYPIGFGGTVDAIDDGGTTPRYEWHPAESVTARRLRHADRRLARPPRQHAPAVVGARQRSAEARRFQPRRSRRRSADRVRLEAVSRVLYPSDETPAGQELRLRQEFFFASASLQDLVRRHLRAAWRARVAGGPCRDPAQRHAPRDRHCRNDAPAGRCARNAVGRARGRSPARRSTTPTTRCCPEALESWPVPLMERLLPRHMQIIYLINAIHLDARARRGARRRGIPVVGVADRGAPRPARAHGASRVPRARAGSTAYRRCTPA